jgi:two-component system, OmpR family, sensor histidine kinase BaeS
VRGGRGRPRSRPPWWPYDERWPPYARRRSGWQRGFGCLFALVFLLVLGAAITFVLTVLSHGGHPALLPGVIALAVLVALAGRTFRRTASTLDELSDAAQRVANGDFAVRVAEPRRGPPPLHELVRDFNAMAERLAAEERQRRSLLADVSHELRTPLSIVQGNLEALLDGVHPPDDAHLASILEETRVLSRLVDDLRTLALSETGSLPLHREPTDVTVLATEVAASFRPAAETAGVTIDAPVGDDLPLLDVDPVRTREILSNLVANALRYTPAGGRVTLRAAVEPAGDRVRLSVDDTGTGIPPDVLPHVFDRFWKSAESRGSGLGLAIARNLVEAHGGTIGAESAPGRGTRIWLTLPVERPAA